MIRQRVTDATTLPLAELATFQSGEQRSDYLVTVQALGEDDTLLSSSVADWQRHGFYLAAGRKLVGQLAEPGEGAGVERATADLLAVERNEQRLQAVVALLHDGLQAEAGLLLQRVQGATLPGHLEAVQGYYLASSGQCAEAAAQFGKARERNKSLEVPASYWGGCRESGEVVHPHQSP